MNICGIRSKGIFVSIFMALSFEVEERTGRLLLTDVPVSRFASSVTPVSVGPAVVGRVELAAGGAVEFHLHKPIKDSGRAFRLDEVLDAEGRIASIELNWI